MAEPSIKVRPQVAGPGKRLPTIVTKRSQYPTTSEESEHKEIHQPKSWTLRDASIALFLQRNCLSKTKSTTNHHNSMHLSSNFGNVDTVLLRIRRDKSLVVRQSFDAAASAVLLAIRKNNEKLDDTEDASYRNYLPKDLETYKKLEVTRSISLDRSHENREYIRRKGGKTEVGIVVHSGESRKQVSTENAKPIDFEHRITEGKANVANKGGTILRIKSSGSTKIESAENDLATTFVSSSQVSGDNDEPIAANSNPSVTPKFTRNTPASSAAALDSRFNSSRAILCVAGNIVFEALTPSFSDEHPAINVLDIPQNSTASAISKKSKKRKKARDSIGSEASSSLEDEQSDEASNDENGCDEMMHGEKDEEVSSSRKSETKSTSVNMGVVSVEAQMLAQRAINVTENAVLRATLRYEYRKDNALSACRDSHEYRRSIRFERLFSRKDFEWFGYTRNAKEEMKEKGSLLEGDGCDEANSKVDHEENIIEDDTKLLSDSDDNSFADNVPFQPNNDSLTYFWQSVCLPRFLSVLEKGAGHAVYHDIQWASRHGRIADLLRALISADGTTSDVRSNNFGPHLIITTEPDVSDFAREFDDAAKNWRKIVRNESKSLQALTYTGAEKQRTKLRARFFGKASGLPETPLHVLITSYSTFLQDYIHFCQIPFETVILDDGVAFMAACDYNSTLGTVWDTAMFSSNDQQIGLAGTKFKEWDFSQPSIVPETTMKDAFVGLTTRHRIMTASAFVSSQRQSTEYVPISGLVDFVAPQFASIAREEWARSRIAGDTESMKHFRKLVARSVIVHDADSDVTDLCTLALNAFKGKLSLPDRSGDPVVPEVISDDDFVSSSKVAFSRRSLLLWLGNPSQSWLRYELGRSNFQPLLEAMKTSTYYGFYCEEITTASSLTASGATGQVAGTAAFRCGVRCGRHFGSEQGLRQHISAQHAPPGTWLCRNCGADCITSQARTHHERLCGQPSVTTIDHGGGVGAIPTVGQGSGVKGGVGKKKSSGRSVSQQGGTTPEEKDTDGSFRVPGYRGVWVNKNGKHFVKIDGKRLTENRVEGGKLRLFDNIDDAARMHDKIAKKEENGEKIEVNFKSNGSRIIYEDMTPAPTSGLGGSAANVVPALSVINIKDLPPDVKPLLRDPRQTSRTGGNSKRHVYAYRGVCRQARKGHDRWQSQISFMGVNHYLGTFDSEWDAAAIYAWAHLILYGEEATKQAQKEGEEAAAAYEQEKRDIAAGKIPAPPLKVEKVKNMVKKAKSSDKKDKSGRGKAATSDKLEIPKKRKSTLKVSQNAEKKPKIITKADKESLGPIFAKGVGKAPSMSPRESFDGKNDHDLMNIAAQKMLAARNAAYCASVSSIAPSAALESLRPCIPILGSVSPIGGVMLLGLPPSLFGWDLQDFVEANELTSEQETMAALQLLAVEYDEDGVNENFKCVIQGTQCTIGSASQKIYESLGLGRVPIGGVCGRTDCHIGGVPGSCSETAACIRYLPTQASDFQLSCLSNDDIVTLNGRRIMPETGSFPLFNEDICAVGARVFVFILPSDK